MENSLRLRQYAVTTLLAGAAFMGTAAENPATSTQGRRYLPWEKGSLKIGGFLAAFDSDLGFGVNNAANVTVDAEEVFGLDSSLAVFRAEAMYRPGQSRRHQLDFTYASYHRDGSGTLSEEIDINGTTYPIGARVESLFDFDIIRGTYSYAFLQNERVRVAVGLGVYAVPLEYGLEIETTGGRSNIEGAETTLPLPALALRAELQLFPRFFLTGGIDGVYLAISDFQGSLLDVNVGLEYRPWQHFGFGLGYNGMTVHVEGEDGDSSYPGVDFEGSVDVRFTGLMIYGKFSF